MFSIILPADVWVLISCVTLTKATFHLSNRFVSSAKSQMLRDRRSILYTTMMSIFPASQSDSSRCSAGRSVLPPE